MAVEAFFTPAQVSVLTGMAAALLLSAVVMKGISYLLSQGAIPAPSWHFLLSPVVSVNSLRSRQKRVSFTDFTGRYAPLLLALSVPLYIAAKSVQLKFDPPGWLMAYVAVPFFVVFTFFWTTCLRALAHRAAIPAPPVFLNPLEADSLADFWGRRWNRYVSDWFNQVLYPRFSSTTARMAGVFLFSGLWHEVIFTVPYYFVTGKNIFGPMTGYFLVQGAGTWVDHRFLRSRSPQFRIAFLWFVIFLPIPWFLNEALMVAFFGVSY